MRVLRQLLGWTFGNRDFLVNGFVWLAGPICIWDLNTGKCLESNASDSALNPLMWRMSPDHRYLAAVADDKKLRLIDWRGGIARCIDIGDQPRTSQLEFSSDSQWLYVETGSPEQSSNELNLVIHVPNRKVILRRRHAQLVGFAVAQNRILLREDAENTVRHGR